MQADDILLDTEERMEKAVNVFRDELRGLRTGRATPALWTACASSTTARRPR